MTGWTFTGIVVIAIAAALLLSGFLRTWIRFRGVRVITCPENHESAAVKVDAFRAAEWAAIAGEAPLRLSKCSRWPEMAGCGQECLAQIESSPEACALQSIVTAWYDGKRCVSCQKEIGAIVWHERPPALRAPDGTSREWKEIAPETLPRVFTTHQPVCWPCHVRDTFVHEHGELVVQRTRIAEPHPVLRPSPNAVY